MPQRRSAFVPAVCRVKHRNRVPLAVRTSAGRHTHLSRLRCSQVLHQLDRLAFVQRLPTEVTDNVLGHSPPDSSQWRGDDVVASHCERPRGCEYGPSFGGTPHFNNGGGNVSPDVTSPRKLAQPTRTCPVNCSRDASGRLDELTFYCRHKEPGKEGLPQQLWSQNRMAL